MSRDRLIGVIVVLALGVGANVESGGRHKRREGVGEDNAVARLIDLVATLRPQVGHGSIFAVVRKQTSF